MAASDMKTPRPGPDSEIPGQRNPADEVTGSQSGTIGGGGREAHNPSPVRATGADDDIVGSENIGSEDAFDEDEFEDDETDDEDVDAEDLDADD
jgi:hypothetical protein